MGRTPRTTHQWLQPLYNYLDGIGLNAPGLGASGGQISFYGFSGTSGFQLATGTAAGAGASGGAAASTWTNGGITGTYYTLSDVVAALKSTGLLK